MLLALSTLLEQGDESHLDVEGALRFTSKRI